MKTAAVVILLSYFTFASGENIVLLEMIKHIARPTLEKFLAEIEGGNNCPAAIDDCPSEVSIWFFTKANRDGQEIKGDPGRVFPNSNTLKVLMHGYQNNHTSPMITLLKDAYLDTSDHNIVAVDWGYYTKAPCYAQARTSINSVAKCVVNFIKSAATSKNFSYIHLLGHSLGAHLAARVSNDLNNQGVHINRLTRFDPALPLFLASETDRGTADFKDTYHSNAGLLGQSTAEGKIDVFLNSWSFQPGCKCDLACSHMRSVTYFAESIKSGKNSMWGFYCGTWEKLVHHDCPHAADHLKEVGENADQSQYDSSFIVFGKPNPPFLYSKEDYLSDDKFNNMKEAAGSNCGDDEKRHLEEIFKNYMKGVAYSVN